MNVRMPVKDLKGAYERLRPDMEAMTSVVNATPAARTRLAKHLNRPGVIFQYAYYTELVRQYLPEGSVVCDWGGQYGHFSKLASTYFPETVCYLPDRDEFEIAYFHAQFGVEHLVRFGPGYGHPEIDLASESVDAVISSGVLEHTREFGISEERSLREIWRIMRPGGTLFIWNFPRRWGSVELLNAALRRSVHRYKYSQRDVIRLVEGAGFQIELLDRHELLNLSTRNALGTVIGHVNAFTFDYYLSKVAFFGAFCQWFTVVARKPASPQARKPASPQARRPQGP